MAAGSAVRDECMQLPRGVWLHVSAVACCIHAPCSLVDLHASYSPPAFTARCMHRLPCLHLLLLCMHSAWGCAWVMRTAERPRARLRANTTGGAPKEESTAYTVILALTCADPTPACRSISINHFLSAFPCTRSRLLLHPPAHPAQQCTPVFAPVHACPAPASSPSLLSLPTGRAHLRLRAAASAERWWMHCSSAAHSLAPLTSCQTKLFGRGSRYAWAWGSGTDELLVAAGPQGCAVCAHGLLLCN